MLRLAPIAAILLISTVPGLAQEARKADPKSELAKLKGTWVGVSIEVDGVKNVEDADKNSVSFDGDKYTVKIGAEEFETGTARLDPTKSPAQIDAMPTSGPNEGKRMEGLYQVDGDTLKIAFPHPGEDRPKELSGGADGGAILMTFKRKK